MNEKVTTSLCSSSSPVLLSFVFIQRSRQNSLSAYSSGFNLARSYSSFDSIGPFLVLKSTSFHPVVCVAQSCRWPSSFLSDWTVMKERSPTLSCFLLSYDDRPPSVQTTTFDRPNFSLSFSSKGLSVMVSAVFPGLTQNASGMPSMSVNSPIWTIGFGLFSFEWPYWRRPFSSSDSK